MDSQSDDFWSQFDREALAQTSLEDDDDATDTGRKYYTLSELKASASLRPAWLIPHLIRKREVSYMYGMPGSQKSLLALALSYMLIHGMKWKGMQLKPCDVLYVCGEGFPGMSVRMDAWFKHHNVYPSDTGLTVCDDTVNLTDPDDVDRFIAENLHRKGSLGLTIIDTLSTSIAGQDEDKSAVMSAAIRGAMKIARILESHVMLIHHPGKDMSRGGRGSSALKGNTDTEMIVTCSEDENSVELFIDKQKNGPGKIKYHFSSTKVELDVLDEFGCPEGCRVVESVDGETIKARKNANDLALIADNMFLHEPMTLTQLAQIIADLPKEPFGKVSAAKGRISATVPLIWTRVNTSRGSFAIRQTKSDGNGKASTFVLRPYQEVEIGPHGQAWNESEDEV